MSETKDAGLPRDVWEAADKVVEAIEKGMWVSDTSGRQIGWGAARMAVGRALLAERKRRDQDIENLLQAIAIRNEALGRWENGKMGP